MPNARGSAYNRNQSRQLRIEPDSEREAQIAAERARYAGNLEAFAVDHLKIIDRDDPYGSAIIPFKFNACQKALDILIGRVEEWNLARSTALWEAGSKVRPSKLPINIVILKARKVGVSTYLQARAFWRCEFNQGYKALVMAHERDSATNLANISQFFDSFWDPTSELREPVTRVSDSLIEWNDEWKSALVVQTAGTKGGGSARGFTFHYEHLSELAFYPPESPQLAAAKRARAKYAETYVESTANGEGNIFHETWERAMDIDRVVQMTAAGEPLPRWWNGSFRFFWPWWADEGNRVALPEKEAELLLAGMDETERALVEQYEVDAEQLAWRRKQIADDCATQNEMAPEVYFRQEDPASPVEAFVSKSRNIFDVKKLEEQRVEQLERGAAPEFVGFIHPEAGGEGFRLVPGGKYAVDEFEYAIEGATTVLWEKPRVGHGYVIGVDTADGLPDGDWTVATIGDYTDGRTVREVGRIRAKIPSREAAYYVDFLGHLYNGAFIVPERNWPGNAFVEKLVELGYPNIYSERNLERITDANPEGIVPGFKTVHSTKSMLVHRGEEAVREGLITLRHPDAIKEWKVFQVLEEGTEKYGAPEGRHDDCVMADLLMLYGASQAPPVWFGAVPAAPGEELSAEEVQNRYWKARVEATKSAAHQQHRRMKARQSWISRAVNPFS